MVNAYSYDGILAIFILIVCSSAYIRRIPKLRQWFLSEKKGFAGVFYKASIVGTRLHYLASASCVLMAVYMLFLR